MTTANVEISIGPETKSAPAVSVIMPAYNTAGLIAESLDSIFAQTYTNYEVIVINDGSPDTEQLEEALRPYRSRIVYIKQNNRRAAGARNTGIRNMRGEFIAFLDSDDCWLPENLATQMKFFERDPSLDMIYADASFMGESFTGKTHMQVCPSKGPVTLESVVVEDCQVCVACTVARKQVIVNAGLFDETLARCDDYAMWLRVAYNGAKIKYHSAVLGKARIGRAGSLGISDTKMILAAAEILTKIEKTQPLPPETRRIVQRRIAYYDAHYEKLMAKDYLAKGDYDRAIASLVKANSFLNSIKLTLIIIGLRIAPSMLRQRLLSRMNS
jgi:glycosyltransferase involved in cell wall biosynthesis